MRRLIIIPTYNERENVVKMIRRLMSMAEGFDLLIVDDGSPDGTARLVRSEQKLFPERLHMIERSGKLGPVTLPKISHWFAVVYTYSKASYTTTSPTLK